MGDPYYDSYKFTPFLKDASGTSIIYRYDENYTPLASVGSSYHAITIEDISYIRFHNQIMGISGDIITHAIGKKDVSLNIYTSTGEYTGDISMVDISGVPFIGYHSSETINGVQGVNVFDLFQYEPSTYTFTPKDSTKPTYTEAVKTSDTEYEDFSMMVKFTSQDHDSTWEATEFDTHIGLYFNPQANNYSYNRIESYKYPTINVNNVVTSRGTDYNNPKNITTELVLPTL